MQYFLFGSSPSREWDIMHYGRTNISLCLWQAERFCDTYYSLGLSKAFLNVVERLNTNTTFNIQARKFSRVNSVAQRFQKVLHILTWAGDHEDGKEFKVGTGLFHQSSASDHCHVCARLVYRRLPLMASTTQSDVVSKFPYVLVAQKFSFLHTAAFDFCTAEPRPPLSLHPPSFPT